jgi:UPF0148 protein
MSRPDEIMAEYLLKGGKMLAESCPVCHNPLFEYKGIRQCVVCQSRENGSENSQEKMERKTIETQIRSDSLQMRDVSTNETIQQAAYDALLHTLLRITQENDVRSISELSTSCSTLTEVYLALIDPQSLS